MNSMIQYLINIFTLVLLVTILCTLSIRLSRFTIVKNPNDRNLAILDKIFINKDTNIYILKICEEGKVVVVSQNGTTVLKDLSKEEILIIEKNINQNNLEKDVSYRVFAEKIKNKIKKFKENRNG